MTDTIEPTLEMITAAEDIAHDFCGIDGDAGAWISSDGIAAIMRIALNTRTPPPVDGELDHELKEGLAIAYMSGCTDTHKSWMDNLQPQPLTLRRMYDG